MYACIEYRSIKRYTRDKEYIYIHNIYRHIYHQRKEKRKEEEEEEEKRSPKA